MELTINQDSYLRKIIKLMGLLICLSLCVIGFKSIYQYQFKKLAMHSDLLSEKSSLITQMHKEMLSITRTQYQILHANKQNEVRQLLGLLSEQVSDYLVLYYQFEVIADSSDAEILAQFRTGFEQWHSFNKKLLGYANVIADSGFINTLSMIDLAFSQFDNDTETTLQLIAELKQDSKNTLSN